VLISENHFIRRTHHGEFGGGAASLEMLQHLGPEDLLTVIFVAMIHDDRDGRRPFVKLIHPVAESAERRNDKMRAEIILLLTE